MWITVMALLPLAVAAELPRPVKDALARANVPAASVSVVVAPADDGAAVVAHNAREPMNPASLMKLFTTYAGLDLLGPAFTFKTRFLASGDVVAGVLDGNLVVRGGGDPHLTYDRLWRAIHQLRSRGVREIRGDVILDRSYFAPVVHDPAKFDGDVRRAYNVGPDALLVNFKAVRFQFIPEADGVRVVGEPDLPNVEIASRLRPVKEACGSWRRNLKYDVTELGMLASITFTGTYPVDCGESSWPLALLPADLYTESVFRWVLSESGGVLRGAVRPGAVPVEARLVFEHESEPLADLIRDINKHSNNVMARQLFLALSAERLGVPGEAAQSARVIADWLKSRGIAAPELVLENGSGLSRVERASAETIAAVLRSAWKSPVAAELMASLPVFAVDGTLRKRNGQAAGRAHLKGGTLTGVQSVAGYVLDARGKRWIVVMIANHANANAAQPAMDALVDWVHRGPR